MAAADELDGKRIESLLGGSEEVYSLKCLPCYRDEVNMPAVGYCNNCKEHLCVSCYKYHKKATLSRHHTLLDKDTMPSTQELTDTPVHPDTTDSLTTPCPHHATETLKFFCVDHNSLLCSICVAQNHTKNCDVGYIPDEMTLNKGYYKQIMSRVDHLLTKYTGLKTETYRAVSKSNDSLKNALLDIKKYRQEINDRIDEIEKEIENKVIAIQHQNDERLKTTETTCEDAMKMLQGMLDNVKQLDTSEQADKLFVELCQIAKQLNEYEDKIFSLSAENRIGEYKFNPSEAIDDVLERATMIGDLSIELLGVTSTTSPRPAPLASSAGGNITPELLGEICVKTSEDRKCCFISGMTALTPDKLVLTDSINNSIKLVDVNKRSIISQLSLGREEDDGAYGITSTTNKQIAVAVPGRRLILFISVSRKLKKTNEIRTDGACYGICCYQKKLIVTYPDSNNLEILDMKGRVITRVHLPAAGEDISQQPDNIKANDRYIYVSDNHHVIVLNWTGEITGTFEDMVFPYCISLLEDGSVIVCDYVTGNLCQISADGAYRGTILQDVRSPNALCVSTGKPSPYFRMVNKGDSGGRRELFISRATEGNEEVNNNILVYKI